MLVNDLKDECFGSGFDSRHLHQLNTRKRMKNLAALLIVTMVSVGPISTINARIDSPQFRMGKWDVVPKVVLCKDSPAGLKAVEKAVEWWSSRGHWINVVDLEQSSQGKKICENVWDSWPSGYIVITELTEDMEKEKDDIALTYIAKMPADQEMIWAKVFFVKNKITKHPRIVEHELGHALGFRHLPTEGHMMHPVIPDGGWDDTLLQR